MLSRARGRGTRRGGRGAVADARAPERELHSFEIDPTQVRARLQAAPGLGAPGDRGAAVKPLHARLILPVAQGVGSRWQPSSHHICIQVAASG